MRWKTVEYDGLPAPEMDREWFWVWKNDYQPFPAWYDAARQTWDSADDRYPPFDAIHYIHLPAPDPPQEGEPYAPFKPLSATAPFLYVSPPPGVADVRLWRASVVTGYDEHGAAVRHVEDVWERTADEQRVRLRAMAADGEVGTVCMYNQMDPDNWRPDTPPAAERA
jgi:hypothetical protein